MKQLQKKYSLSSILATNRKENYVTVIAMKKVQLHMIGRCVDQLLRLVCVTTYNQEDGREKPPHTHTHQHQTASADNGDFLSLNKHEVGPLPSPRLSRLPGVFNLL